MDRKELTERLELFFLECAKREYPIDYFEFVEAFPGDNTTSYRFNIFSSWIELDEQADALDILIDMLWDWTDNETRKMIFGLFIMDSISKMINPVRRPEYKYSRPTIAG